jgi:hypothetical protein
MSASSLLLWHQPYYCTQIGVWIIFFLQVRYDGPNQPEERRLQFWRDSPGATDRNTMPKGQQSLVTWVTSYLLSIPLLGTHKGQSPDDSECVANHVSRPLQG